MNMRESGKILYGIVSMSEKKITKGGNERRGKDDEENIIREEIEKTKGSIKYGKAASRDEISNKVRKYGGHELKSWAQIMCCGEGQSRSRAPTKNGLLSLLRL